MTRSLIVNHTLIPNLNQNLFFTSLLSLSCTQLHKGFIYPLYFHKFLALALYFELQIQLSSSLWRMRDEGVGVTMIPIDAPFNIQLATRHLYYNGEKGSYPTRNQRSFKQLSTTQFGHYYLSEALVIGVCVNLCNIEEKPRKRNTGQESGRKSKFGPKNGPKPKLSVQKLAASESPLDGQNGGPIDSQPRMADRQFWPIPEEKLVVEISCPKYFISRIFFIFMGLLTMFRVGLSVLDILIIGLV